MVFGTQCHTGSILGPSGHRLADGALWCVMWAFFAKRFASLLAGHEKSYCGWAGTFFLWV